MKKLFGLLVFACSAFPLQTFYFVGDEYTDIGNFFSTPFTTGNTNWAGILGNDFGQNITASSGGGTDYAYAFALINGAIIPGSVSITDQTMNLINVATHKQRPTFVWAGADALLLQTLYPSFNLDDVVSGTVNDFVLLKKNGFKTIISLNLFDLGKLPNSGFPSPPPAVLSAQSIAFNAQVLEGLRENNVPVLTIDLFSLLNSVIANPQLYGFTNVTDPSPSTLDYQGYLFWFPVGFSHPFTLPFHQILADYVYSVLFGADSYSVMANAPHPVLRGQNTLIRQQLFPVQDLRECQKVYLFADGIYANKANPAMQTFSHQNSHMGGGIVGLTDRISPYWTIGAAYGLNFQDITSNSKRDRAKFDLMSNIFSVFSNYNSCSYYVNLVGNGALLDFDTHRSFVTGPLRQHAKGDTSGWAFGGELEAAFFLINDLEECQTGPLVRLDYQYAHLFQFKEHGALIGNLDYRHQSTQELITQLGWELRLVKDFGSLRLITEFLGMAGRQWMNNSRDILVREVSLGGPFGVWAVSDKGSWFGSAVVNFSAVVPEKIAFTFGYNLNYGEHSMDESFLTFGLSFPFKPR